MRLIETIKQNKYKTISIIGLAKNSGKTVTLNYLIEEANRYNIKIGITSTGRDGESIDLVTNTQKPTIYVTEGMYVATAKNALMMSTAKVEILQTTGISTPMGEIIILKVRQGGNIQIAGPLNTKDMKYVCRRLRHFGSEVVLVDGAIDRKAVSSPLITDACIIATGAVLSRDIKKVIDRTSHTVECFTFAQVKDDIKQLCLKYNKTCIIQNTEEVLIPDIKTSITGGKKIAEQINEDTDYVFLKGVVSSNLLKDISQNEYLKKIKIIVEDGTKIFVDIDVWNDLKRKGLKIEAINTISVVAITLNPISPTGYFFDSVEFIEKMKHYLPNVKIIDVVSGGEEDE